MYKEPLDHFAPILPFSVLSICFNMVNVKHDANHDTDNCLFNDLNNVEGGWGWGGGEGGLLALVNNNPTSIIYYCREWKIVLEDSSDLFFNNSVTTTNKESPCYCHTLVLTFVQQHTTADDKDSFDFILIIP